MFVCTSVLGFVLFLLLLLLLSINLNPRGQIHLLAASIRTVFFITHEQRLHLFVWDNLSDSNSEDIGLHYVKEKSFLFSLEA